MPHPPCAEPAQEPHLDLIVDSILLFGRCSVGATAGLLFGWATQREKHVRWVVGCVLAGFALGAATMWPSKEAIVAAVLLLIPSAVGVFGGMVTAAGTLGNREDWYIRSWGFIGFLAVFQLSAIGAMAVVDAVSD